MLSGEVVWFEFYTHTAHEPQHPRLPGLDVSLHSVHTRLM